MCKFCKQPKCPPECPNYSHSRFYEQCHYCEGDILPGMEYIETYAGNYYHYNCFKCLTTDEILKETDLEVKTAEHYDWR